MMVDEHLTPEEVIEPIVAVLFGNEVLQFLSILPTIIQVIELITLPFIGWLTFLLGLIVPFALSFLMGKVFESIEGPWGNLLRIIFTGDIVGGFDLLAPLLAAGMGNALSRTSCSLNNLLYVDSHACDEYGTAVIGILLAAFGLVLGVVKAKEMSPKVKSVKGYGQQDLKRRIKFDLLLDVASFILALVGTLLIVLANQYGHPELRLLGAALDLLACFFYVWRYTSKYGMHAKGKISTVPDKSKGFKADYVNSNNKIYFIVDFAFTWLVGGGGAFATFTGLKL
jgi:hypothetical protein